MSYYKNTSIYVIVITFSIFFSILFLIILYLLLFNCCLAFKKYRIERHDKLAKKVLEKKIIMSTLNNRHNYV